MPSKGGQSPSAHLICAASAGEANSKTNVAMPLIISIGPFKNERELTTKDNIVLAKERAKFNIIISPNKACSSLLKVTCLGSDLIPLA